MDETYVRQKVSRAARRLGYWPVPNTDASRCSNCGHLTKPKIGRPDVLWLHPSKPSRVCEIKTLRAHETSFPFDRITPEQRRWLSAWSAEEGIGSLGHGVGYIGLGIIRPAGSRHKLQAIYLVEWTYWLDVEGLVTPIQDSIPLQAGHGFASELQAHSLDIVNLLAPWQLTPVNGEWQIAEDEYER